MKLFSSYRINQINEAKQTLSKINDTNRKVLIIHYSCESFYDKAGYTPRVTCIGILNRENNESFIFSLHLSAQILRKDVNNLISTDLDSIEKHMLNEFANYVQEHSGYIWVHWNMRSASYGFQAISNRYRIIGGNPIAVPDNNKIDLPQVFGKLFSYSFEKDKPYGRLLNMAKRNSISNRDALPGNEEAIAFEKRDFLKLQMSTMRKVAIIDRLLTSQESGKLKHNARIKEIYDLSIPGILSLLKESPLLIIIWSLLAFIVGAALEPIIQKFFGTN